MQISHALRYGTHTYDDGKIFMKFRIAAAWEGGKVCDFLLGFRMVSFVFSSRAAARGK